METEWASQAFAKLAATLDFGVPLLLGIAGALVAADGAIGLLRMSSSKASRGDENQSLYMSDSEHAKYGSWQGAKDYEDSIDWGGR